ncbi:GNAT family N-acetyltransferase [Streptosporangium soli]|nr:GNAT family N-acetyltransferase [Streptosporangium sp. KLBMP 9127]
MDTFSIRPYADSEWADLARVDQEAFNTTDPAGLTARYKSLIEFERSLGAFDGGQAVGAAAALTFTMTVPGGPLPVAGVTAVAVLPSHRRRGILTALMRRQLDDLHENGEAVAALYASESAIYGRFGYGRASDQLTFTIPTRSSRFVPGAPVDERLRSRLAEPAETREELERIYDTVLAGRPGHFARTSTRWDHVLADEDFDRAGTGHLRCLLVEDDEGARGYALFRIKMDWTGHAVPDGEIRVNDLYATDPAAYALLWRGLLDRDLVARVRAPNRPVDDPLIHLLADPRRSVPAWGDELWIRLVDVGRALPARAYAAPVDLVIEVADPLCPWNERRWRLSADESGGVCEATSAAADLTLAVAALGAGYLGGRPLTALVASGAIGEITPGAVRRLSTAMSWDPRPWCGQVF